MSDLETKIDADIKAKLNKMQFFKKQEIPKASGHHKRVTAPEVFIFVIPPLKPSNFIFLNTNHMIFVPAAVHSVKLNIF